MPKEFDKDHAREWMMDHVDLYYSWDGVNCTKMAEDYAQDMNADEWIDDANHEVWDIAADIAIEYEESLEEGDEE